MEGKMTEEKNVITVFEYCDKKRANWILKHINTLDIGRQIDQNHKSKIKEYCKQILKSKNGKVERIYSNDGMSRTYLKSSQYGYQSMIREVRGLLTVADYYDLDIVNCIPTILSQYCILNEIKCPMLLKYVNDRNKIFEDFMSTTNLEKSTIKTSIFITLIFGNDINDEFYLIMNDKQKQYIKNFKDEMTRIKKRIEKLNPNKIVEYTRSQQELKNKDDNFAGSMIAYLVYHLENRIMMIALAWFKKNKYDIGALLFDGLLIRKTLEINEKILIQLENEIFKQIQYKIKFMVKPPELPFEMPEDELEDENDINDELTTQYNEIKKEVEKKYFFHNMPHTKT